MSNVIFLTRVEVTVWRIGSSQWLGCRSWMRLSSISSRPLHGDKSMRGVWEISSGKVSERLDPNETRHGRNSLKKIRDTLTFFAVSWHATNRSFSGLGVSNLQFSKDTSSKARGRSAKGEIMEVPLALRFESTSLPRNLGMVAGYRKGAVDLVLPIVR